MRATQSIFRVRRDYNQWVGNETLEDYALRFTAVKSRRFTVATVGTTALGAAAFLALEALAAAITLQYGFYNALCAMLALAAVIIITGVPITLYAAKHGLDIDLLTRGAGFGYLGSTITSLVYASFTFIFFAIEAAILASALKALFDIPMSIGYVLCALMVLPVVTHGISTISRFQVGTQNLWLFLQLLALGIVAWFEYERVAQWVVYQPANTIQADQFNLALFGACSAILFAMVTQIGEQVDYLRFMPPRTQANRKSWWFWTLLSGPGWILIGLPKMLLGSFIAYLAFSQGSSYEVAIDPVHIYQMAYGYVVKSPTFALLLASTMVVVSQMKINVTNAYAGSIAWSNFFSRLTHSHPGRVVWLVFNVAIALLLMELGIYRVLEAILGIFAIIAISWLGCVAADLLINKPLGISPAFIEFKRSHLYDINPVGCGAMLISSAVGISAYLGSFGDSAQYLAHYLSLLLCFILVPLIAFVTRGRFYLARNDVDTLPTEILTGDPVSVAHRQVSLRCCICENDFEWQDMSRCPAYDGNICSLCCSLDARCLDVCKTKARLSDQLADLLSLFVPSRATLIANSRITRFIGLFALLTGVVGGFLAIIYFHMKTGAPQEEELLRQTLWTVFYVLLLISGVLAWLFLLAHESRLVAQQESSRQNALLREEIEAHQITDAELQQAKDTAERANAAKTRYMSGISHELRTPLQGILGYAQLLQQRGSLDSSQKRAVDIIHNSGEHLADLIEGLLEISKIEAGRMDIYRNNVNIKELLSQLVEIFRQQAEQKQLTFSYNIHNQLPPLVVADEKRLRQILINLLSNAVKYTAKGSVEFHIKYRFQVAEFKVKDTGIGIEASDLERILRPFERVKNRQVPNVAGSGLGLTIVHLLTEVLGGDLKIESQPGLGSEFTVSLMLPSLNEAPPAPLPAQKILGYEGDRKTVLIVDDEAIHRGLLSEVLGGVGFTIHEAPDAESCLQVKDTVKPDLYILDVNLPGMSGLDLADELRDQGTSCPIIILSADATETHQSTDRLCSHDAYVTKPFRTHGFLETVRQLMKVTWIVDTQSGTGDTLSTGAAAAEFSTTSLQALQCHPLFEVLLDDAQIGHKKGFLSTLAEIRSLGLLEHSQVDYLTLLANNMQFQHIETLLSPHAHT